MNRGSIAVSGLFLLLVGCVLFAAHFFVCSLPYKQNVSGHLKQAADANSIPIAAERLEMATKYLRDNGLTTGYTSIIYRTPDEDIGFWYNNLVSAQQQLREVERNPNASPLETTNVLMKLRETLTDHGEKGGTEITEPNGISRYPHNFLWGSVLTLASLLSFAGLIFLVGSMRD